MKNKGKYSTSSSENEGVILKNKLGLTKVKEVELKEAEGQLYAEMMLDKKEESRPKFNLGYLYEIHELIFGELYEFAGRLRTVNLSKAGFAFPAAMHLEQSMKSFEKECLEIIPESYGSDDHVAEVVGKIHAELLFIHPFREGNGRTSRLFANLMVRRAGYKGLDFDYLNNEQNFQLYVNAIQHAAGQNYEPMKKIISEMLEI